MSPRLIVKSSRGDLMLLTNRQKINRKIKKKKKIQGKGVPQNLGSLVTVSMRLVLGKKMGIGITRNKEGDKFDRTDFTLDYVWDFCRKRCSYGW